MASYARLYGQFYQMTAEQLAGPPPRTPAQQAVADSWTGPARSPAIQPWLKEQLNEFEREHLSGSVMVMGEACSNWTVLDILSFPDGPWLWTVSRGKVEAATQKRKLEAALRLAGALEQADKSLLARAKQWAELATQPLPALAGPRTHWMLSLLQRKVRVQSKGKTLLAMTEVPKWLDLFSPGSAEAHLAVGHAPLSQCLQQSARAGVMRLWPTPLQDDLLIATPCKVHADQPEACPAQAEFPAALLAWMWPQLERKKTADELEQRLEECFRPRWEEALELLVADPKPDASLPPPPLFWRIKSLKSDNVGPVEPVLATQTKTGQRKWIRATPAKLAEYGPMSDDDATLLGRLQSLGVDKKARTLDTLTLHNLLMPLIGHSRLIDAEGEPIVLQQGKPELRVEALAAGYATARLLLPTGEPLPARRQYPPTTAEVVTDAKAGVTWIVPWTAELERLLRATEINKGVFPPEATPALAERLANLSHSVSVDLPAALRGQEMPADARLRIRLDFAAETGLGIQLRVEPLPGAPLFAPGAGPAVLQGSQNGKPIWTQRDLDAELDAMLALLPQLPDLGDETSEACWQIADVELAIDALAALDPPPAQTIVQWQDPSRRQRVRTAHSKSALQLEVSNRRDWFAVDGKLTAGELEVPIDRVLQALREGRRYVAMQNGAIVRLADEVRKVLQPLADHAEVEKHGLGLSPLSVGLLQDLPLGDTPPKLWAQALQRWREAAALQPVIPPELRAELRPYQVAGVQWLLRLAHWAPGGVLADDMGLGKTVQTLAVLLARRSLGPQLVVAPLSLLHNWQQEAARFAPDLQVLQLHELDSLDALQPGQLVVASWDRMVRRLDALRGQQWATLVLDEAQNAKNANTQRAKAAAELPRVFCIALTGTPVENRTSELWSLFSLAVPGLLGGWAWFRDTFATAIEQRRDKAVRNRLAQRIGPFLLRRLKRDVAPELPPRTEVQLDITLSDEERALYLAHREAIVRMLAEAKQLPPEQRRMQVLAALTRLRQLACHPQLVEPDCGLGSSKLQALVERLVALREEGHKALVFSQFVRHLTLVRAELEKAGFRLRYLDGQTSQSQRRAEVEAFQAGEGDVFLISLKAGGTGLNLTAASYVFHLDPWWNPAVEDQATDRAHRIGQDQPVTVYRLVADATVEAQIVQLHADKRALVSDLLDGAGSGAALDTAELEALLLAA